MLSAYVPGKFESKHSSCSLVRQTRKLGASIYWPRSFFLASMSGFSSLLDSANRA
jgi:hypothetical protein